MNDHRTDHSVWKDMALGVAGILLQYGAFHPLDIGILGWICLVPWIILAVRPTSYFTWWTLYLSSFLLALCQLRWMTVADYRMVGTWLLLSWWCSLFPWCGLKGLNFFLPRINLPLTLMIPIIWVALEYAKSFLLTGFPWYFLAHTQHSVIPLIQSADLSGTQLLSFAVGMTNGLAVDFILFCINSKNQQRQSALLIVSATISVFLLIVGLWVYGLWRLSSIDFQEGPTVALLQGNHAQAVRNSDEHFQKTWLDYKTMLDKAKERDVDLIVWPETSFPFELPAKVGTSGPLLGRNDENEIWSGPPQLLGVNVVVMDGKDVVCRHNSSMLQDFQSGIVTRYDKIHRVPFGEYIPFKDWIPAMNWLSPYDFDYSIRAGNEPTHFLLPWDNRTISFNSLLCYEDSDFALTRWAMTYNRQPDFWVNQSNDGWFQGTEEHSQHLAIARFRCVETRRSMVRAVNSGISAIIDPCGRLLVPQKISDGIYEASSTVIGSGSWKWNDFMNMSMILVGKIPLCSDSAPYVFFGDWIAWCCFVLLGFGLARYCFPYKSS